VVGLLVYAVIPRQVRRSLREPPQHIPGHTGPPALPTAAVVFALFPPVTLVHGAVDQAPIRHVYGIRAAHLIVCDAVGSARAWYQGAAAGQNALLSTPPP
jgi:hypothetical protein